VQQRHQGRALPGDGKVTEEQRFHGAPDRLRSPQRLALLEVDRTVALCLEGLAAQKVLDVGTGTGIFAEAFAGQGLAVTGVDVNPEMLRVAQQYVPGGTFRRAPAEALPFPDGSFDLVFMGLVLHEADDPARALAEARRVARARVAVLEWPHARGSYGPPLAHRIRPEEIVRLAEDAGLYGADATSLQHLVLWRLGA
jgi:ubiquinone/menaquinone biosynthesis C-methylase UbiE